MNGDDHERILTLEEDMGNVREAIAEMRGTARTWAIIIALIVSPAASIVTNMLTRPTPNDEVKDAAQELIREIRQERRDRSTEANR